MPKNAEKETCTLKKRKAFYLLCVIQPLSHFQLENRVISNHQFTIIRSGSPSFQQIPTLLLSYIKLERRKFCALFFSQLFRVASLRRENTLEIVMEAIRLAWQDVTVFQQWPAEITPSLQNGLFCISGLDPQTYPNRTSSFRPKVWETIFRPGNVQFVSLILIIPCIIIKISYLCK